MRVAKIRVIGDTAPPAGLFGIHSSGTIGFDLRLDFHLPNDGGIAFQIVTDQDGGIYWPPVSFQYGECRGKLTIIHPVTGRRHTYYLSDQIETYGFVRYDGPYELLLELRRRDAPEQDCPYTLPSLLLPWRT